MVTKGTDRKTLKIPSLKWKERTLTDIVADYTVDYEREGASREATVKNVELKSFRCFDGKGTRVQPDMSGFSNKLYGLCRQDYMAYGMFGLVDIGSKCSDDQKTVTWRRTI